MKICVLASGSKGNCIYVESEGTSLLIDAGLSARDTFRRMESLGLSPRALSAICVTHEHTDHVGGIARLKKLLGIPLYGRSACARMVKGTKPEDWMCLVDHSPFSIGGIEVRTFSLPHDAYDPVGYILECGGIRTGIATDLGMVTHLVRENLRRCHVLVLEANHDEQLLKSSARPWNLKQRILGTQGHLSNHTAAELLVEVAGDTLQCVFLAHLSSECNRPDLALHTIKTHLAANGLGHIEVVLTDQRKPTAVKMI